MTGRSVKTVNNQLGVLHAKFGVETTLRLVAVCHARGIGSPAWTSPEIVKPRALKSLAR